MARYIDADLIPYTDDDDYLSQYAYRYDINEVPTADVVPKSEVAREIFEEIESICLKHIDRYDRYIMCCEEFAELKKKYTEEQK